MNRATWSALACLLFLATAPRAAESVAGASVPKSHDASTAQKADTSIAAPLGDQGVRVYIDPLTGELIDAPVTPDQRDRTEGLVLPAPDYSKLTYETQADGSVRAHANGQFQSTSTIRTEADGGTRVGCTQSGPHVDHKHAPHPGAQP